MDVGSAEVKLEENKSLKNDLKKLKDELANSKKSEIALLLHSTAYCCPLGSSINSTLHVQTLESGGNKQHSAPLHPNVTGQVHS